MSTMTLATMIAICGVVWGGFVVFAVLALRREGKRSGGRGGTG